MKTIPVKSIVTTGAAMTAAWLAGSASAAALAAGGMQDVATPEEEDQIVVTGSRARRDRASSISPLQVIGQSSFEDAGDLDAGDAIRALPAVTGVQLDTEITSASVTNAGPGGSAVGLRGLGPDRTLVLMNGRRLAPAGVEGAPSFVDFNLIPTSLIERVEVLLDGAGSVYGSDAIAGVVNLVLKDDFEGVQLSATGIEPTGNDGRSGQVSFLAGTSSDRGHYQIAAEYYEQAPVTMRDVPWTKGDITGLHCSLDIERRADGEVVRVCDDGAFVAAEFRSVSSPLGDAGPSPFAAPGSGFNSISDTDLLPFRSVQQSEADEIVNNLSRFAVHFTGDQELDLGLFETILFLEAFHANRQSRARAGFHAQLFPTVPSTNPTSPFGFDSVPVIASPIRRSDVDTEVSQTRLLSGLRGDFSFAPSWEYEGFIAYTRSHGYSTRPAVLEDRLALSLSTTVENPDGTLSCGNPTTDLFGFNSQTPCVPINLFDPALYDPLNPQFGTAAERQYIEGERTVTTFNDQLLLGGFVTGPAITLPAGDLSLVLGYEYREDSVESRSDTIANTGGAAGFFRDQSSIGSVYVSELYAEAIVPVLKEKPFAHELSIELAGRAVFHEFYGQNTVYAVKGLWAPMPWTQVRATYGTSFRAPGLRELFLGGQSVFVDGSVDPCVVPEDARRGGGLFDPDRDDRLTTALQNCIAEGVDPFSLGLEASSSIEAIRAGTDQVDPELSNTLTFGVSVEQPWTDLFHLQLGATYFEIDIDDAYVVPSAGDILSRCYDSPDFPDDPFCTRRQRNPDTGFLDFVERIPFNLGTTTRRGIDFVVEGQTDFVVASRPFDLSVRLDATQMLESGFRDLPDSPTGDNVGDIGTPEWRGRGEARLSSGPWGLFWQTEFIGTQRDINALTGADNLAFVNAENLLTGQPIFTTEGAGITSDYWNHTASVKFTADTYSITVGVQNVFDRIPEQLDEEAGFTGSFNVPLGVGYDLLGRSVFVSLKKEF